MQGKEKKIAISALSAALLVTGTTAALSTATSAAATEKAPNAAGQVGHEDNGHRIMATLDEDDGAFVREHDVQGTFAFNQDAITPTDDLFNIFGTAITSMCSKPVSELRSDEGGVANFYVNVGGDIRKNFTIDVADMGETQSQQELIACSCMTGSPFGQVKAVGVPLSAVVEMADLEDGVNTVTAYGADGFGEPLPLRYALEKKALLVYRVNDEDLVTNAGASSVQMFLPETVARYFTRNIASIELTREAVEPSVGQVDPNFRNKIVIENSAEDCLFTTDEEITFSGFADDLGSPIVAVEFSFDGGQTWTSCETAGATTDRWVNWMFTTSFDKAGAYQMQVRARTADGVVSPLEASLDFDVR